MSLEQSSPPQKTIHDYVTQEHLEVIAKAGLQLQNVIHQMNVDKGFWEASEEFGTKIALIHSELSEALEADRNGNPPCEKLHEFGISHVEEELADAVIRIFDLAGSRGWNLMRVIEKKITYNAGRPYKHGKKY